MDMCGFTYFELNDSGRIQVIRPRILFHFPTIDFQGLLGGSSHLGYVVKDHCLL